MNEINKQTLHRWLVSPIGSNDIATIVIEAYLSKLPHIEHPLPLWEYKGILCDVNVSMIAWYDRMTPVIHSYLTHDVILELGNYYNSKTHDRNTTAYQCSILGELDAKLNVPTVAGDIQHTVVLDDNDALVIPKTFLKQDCELSLALTAITQYLNKTWRI